MNQMAIAPLKAVAPVTRPNQRALAKQRTREKILTAATLLFSEHGYDGATIRDIAKAAGMSTGAVFASFADKSDLFGEIVAAESKALEQEMLAALDSHGRGCAILAMLDAAAVRHMADLALFQATMSALWTPGLGAQVRRRLLQRSATRLIAEALKSLPGVESSDTDDKNVIAEMIWDGYVGVLRRAALESLTLDQVRGRLAREVGVIVAGSRRN
ncbi:MAG TPA: TetR family transcriptional regulator [Caulobacteraceae bacterium]|jgi:AcrR family transcriptional regulator